MKYLVNNKIYADLDSAVLEILRLNDFVNNSIDELDPESARKYYLMDLSDVYLENIGKQYSEYQGSTRDIISRRSDLKGKITARKNIQHNIDRAYAYDKKKTTKACNFLHRIVCLICCIPEPLSNPYAMSGGKHHSLPTCVAAKTNFY